MVLDKVKLKTINNNSLIGDGNITVGGSSVDIVTSWSSTTSDSKVPSEKLAKDSLDDKISKSSTNGLVKNDGSIDTNSYLTTSSASSTYQTKLVSGTSIKTINNESLLGSGNISVGGSSVDIVTAWESTPSDSKVASEKLTKDTLDGKLDNAISSTAITIASNDNILVTDYSDSNKVKRVANILASQVKDSTAHSNIGSSANDSQATINGDIDTALSNKVSKSSTSGLLKNDGTVDTTSYSTFDGNYNNLTNKPTIPSASSTTPSADTTSGSYGSGTSYARSNHSHPKSSLYAESSHTHTKSQITDFPSLSTVATSGSYSDLSNKPSIPSSSSDLSDGSSLVKTSSTTGLLKNDGSVDTNSYSTTSHTHTYDAITLTNIETNIDYNDYTTQGFYKIWYANQSGNTNKPTTNGGLLIVNTIPNGHSQIFIPYANQNNIAPKHLFYRTHYVSGNTNTWSKWEYLVGGQDIVDNLTSTDATKVLSAKQGKVLNDTKLNTNDLFDLVYPVGSIYMSVNSVNPSTLFGGTWEQIQDKFLLASGTSYSNGATGGSADAVVVEHTHTQNKHRHEQIGSLTTGMSTGTYLRSGSGSSKDSKYTDYATPTINSTGEDGTGKNMPPYLVVNVWKRTA